MSIQETVEAFKGLNYDHTAQAKRNTGHRRYCLARLYYRAERPGASPVLNPMRELHLPSMITRYILSEPRLAWHTEFCPDTTEGTDLPLKG